MGKFYIFYLWIILLCFGENVVSFANVNFYSFLTAISALSLMVCTIWFRNIKYVKNGYSIYWFSIVYILIGIIFNVGGAPSSERLHFIGGPIVSMVLISPFIYCKDLKERYLRILLLIYLVEVFFAIYERVTGHLILGWKPDDEFLYSLGEGVEARSTALHGHPLQNSLIITIIMYMILILPLRPKYKFGLWFLGFVSLLCFNTRAAILVNVLGIVLYNLRYVFVDRKSSTNKIKSVILLITVLISIAYLIFFTNMGGRLIQMGIMDEASSQVRVDNWIIFDYYSFNDFLWGGKESAVRTAVGISIIENPWLSWILKDGIVPLVGLLVFVFPFYKSLYSYYSKFEMFFTLSGFIILASCNNSIAFTFVPTVIFTVSIVLCEPYDVRKYIPSKYLEL